MLYLWNTRKKLSGPFFANAGLDDVSGTEATLQRAGHVQRTGAVSEVHGHESGFDLSVWFSRWASDPAYALCSQTLAPRWQTEWHPSPASPGHGTGCLLLPELPACCGTPSCPTPDPARPLAGTLLGPASPCLLLPACLILLSYAPAHAHPVVPLPPGCVEFSIITIFNADDM